MATSVTLLIASRSTESLSITFIPMDILTISCRHLRGIPKQSCRMNVFTKRTSPTVTAEDGTEPRDSRQNVSLQLGFVIQLGRMVAHSDVEVIQEQRGVAIEVDGLLAALTRSLPSFRSLSCMNTIKRGTIPLSDRRMNGRLL